MSAVITRRCAALAVAAALLVSGCGVAARQPASTATATATADAHHLLSRPDLTPPVISSTIGEQATGSQAADDGHDYVFIGPKDVGNGGAMQGLEIVDATGEPVWVHNTDVGTYGFRAQTYRGQPVLTYWEGNSTSYGHGDVVVLDSSYTEIARVTTGGSVGPHQADMHESQITPQGTMLLTSYPAVQADLSSIGGPADGWVLDGVAQEVDIATGQVLFEWRALDHVPISATYQVRAADEGTRDKPFDFFHLNSVQPDGKGHLLLSARHTHTVYEVDRVTGDVDWQLGGKQSDFTFGPGATFAWQHDARRQDDGTITLFDNERDPTSSRGLRLAIDTTAMTATMVAQYLPPRARLSTTQGNVDVQGDGQVLVGWGSQPFYSRYAADGTLLEDMTFGAGTSYRAYLARWTGHPRRPPDVVIADDVVSVSWNGATEVAGWRVVTGSDADDATVVASSSRAGFETQIAVPPLGPYVAVQAVDASGDVIGTGVPK
jgi:hypothetical protein